MAQQRYCLAANCLGIKPQGSLGRIWRLVIIFAPVTQVDLSKRIGRQISAGLIEPSDHNLKDSAVKILRKVAADVDVTTFADRRAHIG